MSLAGKVGRRKGTVLNAPVYLAFAAVERSVLETVVVALRGVGIKTRQRSLDGKG